jgi:hypothetical protein
MSIFESLMDNKGTISTTLGKKLAKEALGGDWGIADEAIRLCAFELSDASMRHLRSGAGKIVEIVAEARPELVAPRLEELFPALAAAEPQTRWMIIRTFGFCAGLNEAWAKKAIPFAKAYVESKEGLCLRAAADRFLGDYGALSEKNAAAVMPILQASIRNLARNEEDWILEAFIEIAELVDAESKAKIIGFAKRFRQGPKKSTQARAKKLLKLTGTA